jgi:hypothetical protein
MIEMDPERIEAQVKIQTLMSVLINSLVDKTEEYVAMHFSDTVEEDELDVIMALSFIRSSAELAVLDGIDREQFLRICEEVYMATDLHISPPAGTA